MPATTSSPAGSRPAPYSPGKTVHNPTACYCSLMKRSTRLTSRHESTEALLLSHLLSHGAGLQGHPLLYIWMRHQKSITAAPDSVTVPTAAAPSNPVLPVQQPAARSQASRASPACPFGHDSTPKSPQRFNLVYASSFSSRAAPALSSRPTHASQQLAAGYRSPSSAYSDPCLSPLVDFVADYQVHSVDEDMSAPIDATASASTAAGSHISPL